MSMPASLPYVTAVGGTEFNEGAGSYWSTLNNTSKGSALAYIPDTAWNDTSATYGLAASGGGASTLFRKPFWQSGSGVPADSARDVPDVSLNASAEHDGYMICSEQYNSQTQTFSPVCPAGFFAAGGTSAPTPSFAGIVALLNEAMNSAQGNINGTLYSLASLSASPFHDITSGGNAVPCQTTPDSLDCPTSGSGAGVLGYSATAGYDMATGLGSVDANALIGAWPATALSPNFDLSVAPSQITVSRRGGVATAQIEVNAIGGMSGSPSLACSVPSIFLGVTCSIALNPGTSTYTLTVRASNTAAALLPALSPLALARPASRFGGPFVNSSGVGAYLLGMLLAAACLCVGLQYGARRQKGKAKLMPALAGACSIAVLLAGCAGVTSTSSSPQVQVQAAPVSIQLTPQNALLGQNEQQAFTATVANSANASVTWSVSPGLGSNSPAQLVDIYTAPAAIVANQTVTLTATSVADPTKQASANILLATPEAGALQVVGSINGLSHSVGISLNVN